MLSKELARLRHRLGRQASRLFDTRRSKSMRAAQHLYWTVSMPFFSILGEGTLRITMPPDDTQTVAVEDLQANVSLRFRRDAAADGLLVLERLEQGNWKSAGRFSDTLQAVYEGLRQVVEARMPNALAQQRVNNHDGHPLALPAPTVPRMFRMEGQWQTAMHRSGWGFALDSLRNLHHDHGVLFEGFVESTFCWRDTGRVYRKPWVGVIHNPPQTPEWYAGGRASNDYLFSSPRWHQSLDACQGLFVLSEYHRQVLQDRVRVPISVLTHPTEFPERKFDPHRFVENPSPKLVQIGSWLRNPNSIYKLHSPWLTKARLDVGQPWEEDVRRHMPSEPLDLASVEVIPRLDNDAYDRLLTENVVFLDLLDASANNAVIECIVRHTPLLVNEHPAVVEYLGADYPLYFSDLAEASRKAADRELILRAHEFLRDLSKHPFTREAFVEQVIRSDVYQSLLPSPVEPFLLLAHARTGSTTLMKSLAEHPQLRLIHEPFHPDRASWGHSYIDDITDSESLDRTLDELYYFYTGIKHLICQLPAESNEQIIRRTSRTILLTRRNLLQAVVSEMIARQTRIWHGTPQQIRRAKLKPLDFSELEREMALEQERLDQHRRILTRSGRPFLELFYEDLFGATVSIDQRLDIYRQILHFLGVDTADAATLGRVASHFDPDRSKLTTEATYRRLPNAPLIDLRLGNQETGFLFDHSNHRDEKTA